MAPIDYVDPPNRDWELRPLAIVVSDRQAADAVSRRMSEWSKRRFGLFDGGLGKLAGVPAALVIADGGENPTYVALRQLSFLFRPTAALYLGGATAAVEWLKPGDLAWVRQARRCFHPVAIADNMFHDDEAVFNVGEARQQTLDAPMMDGEAAGLEKIQTQVVASDFGGALQAGFPGVVVGSSEGEPSRYRGLEFARSRFGIDVVDHGSYGFLMALKDEQLAGVALLQVRAGCSVEYPAEFRDQTARFSRLAGEVAEAAVRVLLGEV